MKNPNEMQKSLIYEAVESAVFKVLEGMGGSWNELSFFNGHKYTDYEIEILNPEKKQAA